MKKIFLSLAISTVFFCSASAQTVQNTWGLGVGLVSGGAVFHVPIIFDRIRIEPEISFRTSSNSNGSTYYYSDSYENVTEASSTSGSSQSISIGIGTYYSFPIDKIADWYIGPRIGLSRSSSLSDNSRFDTIRYLTHTDSTSQSTSQNHIKQHSTSYFIGAVFGGEYYLSSHFSVGAELQVTYNNSGQPVIDEQSHLVTPSPAYNSTTISSPSTSSSFAATTAVFIRWYF